MDGGEGSPTKVYTLSLKKMAPVSSMQLLNVFAATYRDYFFASRASLVVFAWVAAAAAAAEEEEEEARFHAPEGR